MNFSGFVVDYQALRQQLDETPKKSDVSSEGGDVSTTPETRKPSVDLNTSDSKQKDILDKAEKLLKTAEKLVEPRSKTDPPSKSDLKHSEEKQAKREFTLPKPVLSSSPASVRTSSSTPTSSSLKQQQQQLSDLALLQQMNAAAGMADPATAAALLGIPPELLHNLTPGKYLCCVAFGGWFDLIEVLSLLRIDFVFLVQKPRLLPGASIASHTLLALREFFLTRFGNKSD